MGRDYSATTGTDGLAMMNSLLMRGAVVGGTLAIAWLAGRSMFNDLREEWAAGLT